MATLSIPEFISADAAEIKADMIAFYEGLTGRTLAPADTETLLFNTFVYREIIYRNTANDAALQNLAAFATFPVLDYLAQNVGIPERLPAQKAKANVMFTLLTGHSNLVIQAGTRVSHPDGVPVFAVIEDTFVGSSVDEIEIECEAETEGTAANGFDPGAINVLIDSFADADTVENTTTTAGGSEEETDEQLRQRIYLAPTAFSNCGSIEAYRFFALSAHPSIIDVAVEGPEVGKAYPPTGVVAIYPLTGTVPTPTAVLNAVEAICSANDKRPCTDTVEVSAPTAMNYAINVSLMLYNGADDQAVIDTITDALNSYKETKGSKLGSDIIREQIIALCMVEGVYKPTLSSPASDVQVPNSSFGNCTGITVTIAGFTNG